MKNDLERIRQQLQTLEPLTWEACVRLEWPAKPSCPACLRRGIVKVNGGETLCECVLRRASREYSAEVIRREAAQPVVPVNRRVAQLDEAHAEARSQYEADATRLADLCRAQAEARMAVEASCSAAEAESEAALSQEWTDLATAYEAATAAHAEELAATITTALTEALDGPRRELRRGFDAIQRRAARLTIDDGSALHGMLVSAAQGLHDTLNSLITLRGLHLTAADDRLAAHQLAGILHHRKCTQNRAVHAQTRHDKLAAVELKYAAKIAETKRIAARSALLKERAERRLLRSTTTAPRSALQTAGLLALIDASALEQEAP